MIDQNKGLENSQANCYCQTDWASYQSIGQIQQGYADSYGYYRQGCPYCGRCPHCGRSYYTYYPYHPWEPYPYYPQWQITCNTQNS